MPTADLFAIILAGGASSRLHSSSPEPIVDKPFLELEGSPMITRVLTAARRVVAPEHLVVVGPESLPTGEVTTVYEDPPQSGPYMAVHTALQYFKRQFGAAQSHQGVMILAADMPHIDAGIDLLYEHHRRSMGDESGAIIESAGHLQPLLSYVPRPVAEQIFAQPILEAGILRTLRSIEYRVITADPAISDDLDTYEDVLKHGARWSREEATDQESIRRNIPGRHRSI